MFTLRNSAWFIKLTNQEFWPLWLFYIPVWVQHFWLSLKVKSLFFFLRTNPAVDGFILSDSKYKTLRLVPENYRPRTILVDKQSTVSVVLAAMMESNIVFPIILKPDIGFRGLGVRKIDDPYSLDKALDSIKVTYILQEFIQTSLELGIFYYRYPNEKSGHIPSITIKEFLKITGNGKDTMGNLVLKNPRAFLLEEKLKRRFEKQWGTVLENGQNLELECIGNHNRGTKFVNGNHLVNEELLGVFDELSHRMEGFYFGRFDIKTTSLEAIKNSDYKILEVNGVGGEPTHIYDPDTPLFKMLNDLCSVWRVAAKIASINFDLGIKRPTYREAYMRWRAYSSYKAKLVREF